jgi:post-segregation antitoxin (ccd killing protein)
MPPTNSTVVETPRKRAVNLTLNEDLVVQARSYTANLSATMEGLLETYVEQQRQAHVAHREQADACARDWNAVHDKVGSFADEHSTL